MNNFVDYMETHRRIYETSEFKYKKYLQIQRSFRNVFSTNTNVEHLIYVHEADCSIYENDYLEICKLVGYLYSKNVCSSSGISLGEAIKKTKSEKGSDKYLNNLLESDFKKFVMEIKNLCGLISSNHLTLNPHSLHSILCGWKSQTKSENKNWVKKKIIKDYFKKEEENVSN